MPDLLPDYVMKRIARAGGKQERHGTCLLCKRDFDDCPHDIGQIETLLLLYRQQNLLRLMRW